MGHQEYPFFICVIASSCGGIFWAEKLKLGLCVETRAWQVAFGQAANKKYGSLMHEVLEFAEDLMKRLHRPIKDLDDIRYAIAALKELRAEEIRVDMSIDPIEVCQLLFLYHSINTACCLKHAAIFLVDIVKYGDSYLKNMDAHMQTH